MYARYRVTITGWRMKTLPDDALDRGNKMLAKVQMDFAIIKAMVAVNVILSIISWSSPDLILQHRRGLEVRRYKRLSRNLWIKMAATKYEIRLSPKQEN